MLGNTPLKLDTRFKTGELEMHTKHDQSFGPYIGRHSHSICMH